MKVSVILSTYNSPEWLGKVVLGYSVQTHRDFELIIADDGSTQETTLLIHRLRKQTGLTINHVWHEDCGFRKCTILNKAILASSCEYLVFSDGDCIPRWDFVATHVEFAQQGYLLSGGAVRLPMALSKQIAAEDILSRRVTDLRWLAAHGLLDPKRLLKTVEVRGLTRLLDALTTTQATWNGGNASTWKSEILRVNGYDERMEHGGLDRELGDRLVNAGLKCKQIRHRAVCLHLDHGRPYAREDALRRNLAIRQETQCSKAVWTPYGIDRHLGEVRRRAA
jgi:glycosyltransferase involved in cell wall biosynthesis